MTVMEPDPQLLVRAMPRWKRLAALWGLAFAAATFVVLVTGMQKYMVASMTGKEMESWFSAFRWSSILWYGWALFGPLVILLARWQPFTRATWRRALLIHAGGCLVFYGAHVSLQVWSMSLPVYRDVHDTLWGAVTYHLSQSVYLSLFTYAGLVALAHVYTFYERYRLRELQAARLQTALSEAQLEALKMQLQPHFLFNTLHSISTLMYRDLPAADRMVARLSAFLRMVLESEGEQEVPLWEEMTFLRKYLEIEQIRFADRLTVTVDLDPSVEEALVPNLILQPIVENAIQHGIAPRAGGGRITIRARAEGDRLHLTVADDGPGMNEANGTSRKGVGLSNTRARLGQLYGRAYSLALRRGDPSGLTVELVMPLRREEDHTVSTRPMHQQA